jgi:zeaxanthin glucosyltransferase
MRAEPRKWHFGVLSFTGTGHLNPLIAVAQGLKSRGHRVTFFEKTKIEERVRHAGLEFVPIGTKTDPKQEAPPAARPGIRSEISMLRFNLKRVTRDIMHYLAETPSAISSAGVDALLINEVALTGPTVAQMLGLPYFLISTSVPHHFGWQATSWFTGRRYISSPVAWLQSALLEISALRMHGPIRRALDKYRREIGLGPIRDLPRAHACLAHITQLPECLDLPHRSLHGSFYYTGPWVSSTARPHVDFPWDRLDGRSIVYATFGTTRNAQEPVLRMISEACQDLDLQLVISLGNRFEPQKFSGLPGNPLIVKFAPQLDLLKIAQLVITHGGANTSLEALTEGKPMVVIPLAYDQPAVAARLERLHVAEVLPVMRLATSRIRSAVVRVLNDARYRNAAQTIRSKILSIHGEKRAADIIAVEMEGYAARQRLELRSDRNDPIHRGVFSNSAASQFQR